MKNIFKGRFIVLAFVLVLIVFGGYVVFVKPPTLQTQEITSVVPTTSQQAWKVRCSDDKDGEPKLSHCEVVQRQTVTETGQRLVEFAIGFSDKAKDARGVLILPLGIMTQTGLSLTIDDHKPMEFKIRYCVPHGCYAHLALNKKMLSRMKKGQQATISIHTNVGQNINFAMPLSGFAKALDEVG